MTNYLEVIILGLILSADSFSAALAMGARKFTNKDAFKFAFSSGGAEALVCFIGTIAGAKIIARFDSIDHWISFILLVAIGLHMIFEGYTELTNKDEKVETEQFHSFFKVLVVSFATSLDAFAIGVSLGISDKPVTPYIISIGLFAFVSTILGLNIAKRASNKLGPIFSFIGAAILIILAFKQLH